MKTKLLLLCTFGLGIFLAIAWLAALTGVAALPARAAGFTVCPAGPPTCDYSVIQTAVDDAGEGEVIKVAAGTYTDLNNHFGHPQIVYIDKNISIVGGYTTAFTEPPDPAANPTTLDAGGLGRVLYIEGNVSPTIEGLQITGGQAAGLGGGPYTEDVGGGVYIFTASATLKDNVIFENSADSTHNGDGGGIFLYESDATLEYNTIISNTAQREGGGINMENSPATLTGNTISQNYAGIGQAAGVYLGYSPATIYGNTISDNDEVGLWVGHSAALIIHNTIISNTGTGSFLWESDNTRISGNTFSYNLGGGLDAFGNNLRISGNTISYNSAEWGAGFSVNGTNNMIYGNTIAHNTATRGGGGFFGSGPVSLVGNTFIANQAEMGGGLLIPDSIDVQLTGNTFSENSATNEGGGLELWGGNPVLTNNLIVNNQCDGFGSGLYTSGSTIRLLHNTIARNTGGDGTGIYAITNSNYLITNTIIVSQTVGIYVHFDASATFESTLWGNGTWANGTDWSGAGTMDHNNTHWGDPAFVDYLAGDFHIDATSDAKDAGIDSGVLNDIDQLPRPYLTPDIGADEYWPLGTLKFIYLPIVN